MDPRYFQAARRPCRAALYKRQALPNCTSNSSLCWRVVNSRYLNVFLKIDFCLGEEYPLLWIRLGTDYQPRLDDITFDIYQASTSGADRFPCQLKQAVPSD